MILTALLLILEVLCSFMLIGIILIQKSKGGGLGGSAFGGGGGDSLFGARAGNVLTKITIGLSIFFLANTLVLAFIYADSGEESVMQSAGSGALEPLQPIPPDADGVDAPAPPVDGEQLVGDIPEAGEPIALDQPVNVPPVELPPIEVPEAPPVEAPAEP